MQINNDEILSLEVPKDEQEEYFTYRGCDNCNDSLGNDITPCKAWTDHQDPLGYYEIDLCWNCICAYHNATELHFDCQNIYEI